MSKRDSTNRSQVISPDTLWQPTHPMTSEQGLSSVDPFLFMGGNLLKYLLAGYTGANIDPEQPPLAPVADMLEDYFNLFDYSSETPVEPK